MGECCKRILLSASFGHREYIVLFLVMFQLVRVLGGYTPKNQTKIPAVFAFGDSIIDPGNNNHLKTLIKCNFPPYGKDFIGHQPTGRFSNGKIPTDLLVSGLGIKELLPPYLGCISHLKISSLVLALLLVPVDMTPNLSSCECYIHD
uniref:GDSL esterase/lipase n=1 Tax=Ananas comosus var. bracteatus TaxID=296719 RepID=A0A6V7NK51_ANACO|nr:unnamed protein product [Ananas comosus var. bracteatus]